MLLTMVKEIIAADGLCDVVAETSDDRGLSKKLDDTAADVVILTAKADDADANRFSKLLADHPKTRVLAIATNGHRAFLHELRPCVTEVLELSPQTLLAAIKQGESEDQRGVRGHG
jgi:DNA-binding NarL/FixJ family response regulator